MTELGLYCAPMSQTTRGRPAIVGLEALTTAADAHPHTNGSVNGQDRQEHQNGSRPVVSHAQGPAWKIAAVVPCFNRRQDLQLLLKDVSRQDLRPVDGRPIKLWLVVVDNASSEALSTVAVPPGVV